MNSSEHGYHELVGLFQAPDNLEKAISTLTSSGWDHADLSMLAQHKLLVPESVDEESTDLADDPEAERRAPVSDTDVRQGRTLAAGTLGVAAAFLASGATIMTGGGALAAIVGAAAAGGGAGALVEAFGQRAQSERDHFLNEQMEQGGILLWAKLENPEEERKARDIFERCGATDIKLHGAAWSKDDDNARSAPR
jgi:hypothetical protein